MGNNPTANDKYINGMFEFMKNNYGRCIELLSQAIEQDPNHKLAFLSRGSAYMKLGKLDKSVADFDKAIAKNPDYARAYHLRGFVHEKRGSYEYALNDFDKAIELDPEYGAAYYSRATLHTKMGNEDLALEDMEMITHLTNKNIEVFANENNVWRSQQLRVEAITESEMNR
jgi:tetratricopeptide (TPR) repeat protein